MNILSIKAKGKNPNLFVVKTEETEFVLHSDIIVKFGLRMGEVDESRFNEAKEESEILIATNRCLNYLNQHIKTEKQIKDYLYKLGYKSKVVNVVLAKLKEYNLINDKIFAQSYINSNPSFSKIKLKQKLQGFGVKTENFEEDLDTVDEVVACKKEVEKFFKLKSVDKENIEKITRRLITKGYSWDSIKQVLSEFKYED